MSDIYYMVPPHARKVAAASQMREFDRRAVEEFGVPSIVLMENAARHVFEAVRAMLGDLCGKRVTIVAGRGNNGGDGFVVARHLRDAGAKISVYVIGNLADIKGDAKINLDILTKTGLQVKPLESAAQVESAIVHSHAIVDAIFGTGLRGEVTGLAADVIRAINDSGRPVVAVDIPSGLDADTGQIWGVCIKADRTVTFALPKIGLLTYPGAAYVGELIAGDIGIPQQLYDEIDIELTGGDWVASRLPNRPSDANKGTFGTTVVIAGSAGFTGAAVMASEAVLRSGAGLSILAVPESLQTLVAGKLTEVMTRGLPETDSRSVSERALDTALDLCRKGTAAVIGCGLGTHPDTCNFVRLFVRSIEKPFVVDADGLNCLANSIDITEGRLGEMIITPHPGEMARLLGTTTAEIQSNRLAAAREASRRFNCITVLKGARTLIADPSGRVFINPTGDSGMATGGTGDVLAGAIGGLLAQGLSPFDAAVCGVYIHGRAGEIASSEIGPAGMVAGDLLISLPEALKELYLTR